MQQLLGFFVSICLFAAAFAFSADAAVRQQNYRISKQNLNLTGREIINYICQDSDSQLYIDENAFLQRILELDSSGDIIGCIFSYKDHISISKINLGNFLNWKIDTKNMKERNKINTINNMMHSLLSNIPEQFEINIWAEDSNDYYMEEFFNKLSDNTVYIIGYKSKKVFLSGFSIDPLIYPQKSVDKSG